MVSSSNNRRKHSCSSSSSSDNDADPDFTIRLSRIPSPRSSFSSLRKVKAFKTSPAGNSTVGENIVIKKGDMAMKKTASTEETKVKMGHLNVERFKNEKERRPSSRREKRSDEQTEQETGLSAYRSCRRSGNDGPKKQGFSCRIENPENGNGNGRRKMKATLFSWLIDSKTMQEDTILFLAANQNKNSFIKKGTLKRDGILCCCCSKFFSAEGFASHGGRRTNKPYEKIFTVKKKISLLSYMIQAWNKPEESEHRRFNSVQIKGIVRDPYDDACMICADGGNLMCCEECNSTYHRSCMGMKEIPIGSWYCPYCICKFCSRPARNNDDLLDCPQCEKKYHWQCHQKRDFALIDMNNMPCAPFCERSCKEVYEKLQRSIVGKKNELDEGFSWTLLRRMDDDTGIYIEDFYDRALCHSKLALAHKLMEDCFEPIIDRYTRIKVIPSVVYNSGANFRRIQFRGFYTAVLEKDEEIISAASLRIHGTKLAEMPFIATSDIHRCKGMCKKLMIAIESALCYLNVEYLIIPSVSERIGGWIEKYGFRILDAKVKREIMYCSTLMFHDSTRLQKSLVPSCLQEQDRDSEGTPTRKARNKDPQNFLSYSRRGSMASPLDLEIQPHEGKKKRLIKNRK